MEQRKLTEIVDHYSFDVLFAYLNINRFQSDEHAASDVTGTPTKGKVDRWTNWRNKT